MTVTVAVYGATGTTGALVVSELERRGLRARPLRRDHLDVDLAGAGADVVVNCAGPFSLTRVAVEDAAIRTGVDVVHVCGEPEELTALFARHSDFVSAGITVVGGAGFSSTMAELCGWLAIKGLAPPIALEIVHAASASMPSEGSLRSYLEGVDCVDDDDDVSVIALPAPFGERTVRAVSLAEGVTLQKSLGVQRVSSWMAVGPPRAAIVRPPAFLRDRATLQRMLIVRAERGERGPSPDERAAMAFAIQATASTMTTSSGPGRVVEMAGVDPYGLTAVLAVQAAIDVAARPKPGARAPLEILDATSALSAVARAGVRWTVRPKS